MPGTGAEEIRGCSDTLREMWTMITTAMLVLSLMLMLLSWVGGRRAKATRSTSLEFAGGSLASDRTHHTRIPHRSLIPYTATMDAVKDLAETPQRFIKEGTQVSGSGHRCGLRAWGSGAANSDAERWLYTPAVRHALHEARPEG